MKIELTKEVVDLINNNDSLKILTTVDEQNVPHAVIKQSLHVGENGDIQYLELFESSLSYKNFTRSLWFDRRVSILVKGADELSYQIKGKPVRIIISGPELESSYLKIRAKLGDVDLASICSIEPEEVVNETFWVKYAEQEKSRPYFKHLDRLAK